MIHKEQINTRQSRNGMNGRYEETSRKRTQQKSDEQGRLEERYTMKLYTATFPLSMHKLCFFFVNIGENVVPFTGINILINGGKN